MSTTTTIDRITLYRDGQTWCYAAWIGTEADHTDTLPDAVTEADARAEVTAQWPDASIVRVDDVTTAPADAVAAAKLLGRRGGQTRTAAKAEASRANGRKGGRPRR